LIETIHFCYHSQDAMEVRTVDPDQLETFLAVVRLGGMRPAAAALHVTQPAVSVRVRELENRLEARLFERVGRRVELTETGRLLAAEGPAWLAARAELVRRVRESAGAERRTLRLATIDAASIYVLPEIYLEFRGSHPQVQLIVQVVDSRHVLAAVAAREADVGVVALPSSHPEIEAIPIFEEQLVCVASPDHPLVRRARVSLSALAAEPLVLFGRGSTTRSLLDAVFEAHGVVPNVVMETASPEAMKRLAEVGVGATILPEPLVRSDLATRRLGLVRLRDAGFVRRLAAVVHRGRALPPPAREFLDLVLRHHPPLDARPGPAPRRRESDAGPTSKGGPRGRRTRRRSIVSDESDQ
jgi:DNA-binding transcriptional LysR family regulator